MRPNTSGLKGSPTFTVSATAAWMALRQPPGASTSTDRMAGKGRMWIVSTRPGSTVAQASRASPWTRACWSRICVSWTRMPAGLGFNVSARSPSRAGFNSPGLSKTARPTSSHSWLRRLRSRLFIASRRASKASRPSRTSLAVSDPYSRKGAFRMSGRMRKSASARLSHWRRSTTRSRLRVATEKMLVAGRFSRGALTSTAMIRSDWKAALAVETGRFSTRAPSTYCWPSMTTGRNPPGMDMEARTASTRSPLPKTRPWPVSRLVASTRRGRWSRSKSPPEK